jgi:hypothetical protein
VLGQAFRAASIFTCVGIALSSPHLHAQTLGPPGTTWGGEHVRLEATEDGANIEFDCATGTLNKALTPDAGGSFTTRGTFTPGHGGPVRQDSSNPAMPATYSGKVAGNTLTLHIAAGARSDTLEDYTLIRGQPGHVVKCR